MKTRIMFLRFLLIFAAVLMPLIVGDPFSVDGSTVRAQASHPFIVPNSGTLPSGACGYGHYHCPGHPGIDIWTQASGEGLIRDSCGNLTKGNPLYAAYEGTITGLRDVYSRPPSHEKFDGVIAMVIIEHHIDESYRDVVPELHVWTFYTHMASQTCNESFVDSNLIDRVSRGDTHVEKGHLLGYQGNRVMAGGDAITHLHFQINTAPTPKSCQDFADPTPYIGVDCTVCPQTFHAEPTPNDSTVISSDSFKVLQPGQTDEITFDVQNTGMVTWTPQGDYTLINTDGVSLGASPIQALTTEVPPGRIARWVIPITAPSQVGVNWTEWQMAYNEEPFGSMMAGLIIVAPEGEIDFDLLALLEEWVNELKEQISAELKEFWENLKRQFMEWLQNELERLWREFWESLCGASAMAPAALLLGAWSISHRQRGGTKHHNDRS